MTSPAVLTGDFTNATRATGTRCTGVGKSPNGLPMWGRATCPDCMLSQRVTEDQLMMSHYVMRKGSPPAAEVCVPEARPLTLVPSGLQEVIADLNTPNEPSTVGEFVKAIIALSGALATARIRIAELERAPQSAPAPTAPAPSPVNHDEVAQWEADWLELNYLLAHYAVDRSWCTEFEEIIRGWNRTHFQRGYLLTRHNVGARRDIRVDRQSADQQRVNSSTLSARRTAAKARHQAANGR